MTLKTIYSPSLARGWLPWGLLAPILCIVLSLVTGIPSGIVLAKFGLLDAHDTPVGTQGLMAFLLLSFITWLLAVLAWTAFVERRDAGTIGLGREGAGAGFLRGLVAGVVTLSAVVTCIWLTGAYTPAALFPALKSPGALAAIAGLLACFIVQASIEEIIFRGWLLSVITRRTNIIIGVVLSSLTFTLMHFSRGQPWLVTLNVLLFAGFACGWSIWSNNIWGAMGWHSGWNWILATGFDVPVTGLDAGVPALTVSLAPTGPDYLTGGAQGPEGSIFCTLFFVCGMTVFAWRIARTRKNVGLNHSSPPH